MTTAPQFSKGAYAGVDGDTMRDAVRRDGWDPATMRVHAGGKTFDCRPGDQLVIPGGVEHAAEVGPDGCLYLWSEQIREVG